MDDNKQYFKSLLPKRAEDSHKGTFGHVLNIAGSEFYTGAAFFSSVAALKIGAGRCTLASDKETLQAVASLSPDVILMPVENINKRNINDFDAISIGCGLSREKSAVKLFENIIKILENSQIPVVIDADGLNILASCHCDGSLPRPLRERVEFQNEARVLKIRERGIKLPSNTILTPHPKEMSRLMGVETEEILKNPEHWVKECAKKYDCTAILKLHKTLVADNQGNFYKNNTGNSALAKGGSGDLLCGMITGYLASGGRSEPELVCNEQAKQGELNDGDVRVCDSKLHRNKKGLDCFEAACLGVYLHGLAGEIAGKDLTEHSVLASDLINYIPKAIKTILT